MPVPHYQAVASTKGVLTAAVHGTGSASHACARASSSAWSVRPSHSFVRSTFSSLTVAWPTRRRLGRPALQSSFHPDLHAHVSQTRRLQRQYNEVPIAYATYDALAKVVAQKVEPGRGGERARARKARSHAPHVALVATCATCGAGGAESLQWCLWLMDGVVACGPVVVWTASSLLIMASMLSFHKAKPLDEVTSQVLGLGQRVEVSPESAVCSASMRKRGLYYHLASWY